MWDSWNRHAAPLCAILPYAYRDQYRGSTGLFPGHHGFCTPALMEEADRAGAVSWWEAISSRQLRRLDGPRNLVTFRTRGMHQMESFPCESVFHRGKLCVNPLCGRMCWLASQLVIFSNRRRIATSCTLIEPPFHCASRQHVSEAF